jgi:soluble lytic murein transglycosylase-like protein
MIWLVILGAILFLLLTAQKSEEALIVEKSLDDKIKKYAALNGLDWLLVKSICQVESNLNPKAIGDDGASLGLMQIQKSTAKGYGATDQTDLLDEENNLQFGCAFLADLIKKYGLLMAIEIYNLGETKYLKGYRSPDYLNRVIKVYSTIA